MKSELDICTQLTEFIAELEERKNKAQQALAILTGIPLPEDETGWEKTSFKIESDHSFSAEAPIISDPIPSGPYSDIMNKKPSVVAEKKCPQCRNDFTPRGNRQIYCQPCREELFGKKSKTPGN